jgi:hypothetical protein
MTTLSRVIGSMRSCIFWELHSEPMADAGTIVGAVIGVVVGLYVLYTLWSSVLLVREVRGAAVGARWTVAPWPS